MIHTLKFAQAGPQKGRAEVDGVSASVMRNRLLAAVTLAQQPETCQGS